MNLYLDCEFTDLLDCYLISIGIVSEDGRAFYAECNDFPRSACNAFVCEAVLPQLSLDPSSAFAHDDLHVVIRGWLSNFNGGYVCVDHPIDWELFVEALGGNVPDNWKGLQVSECVSQTLREEYFAKHGGRHHALYDAWALRASLPADLWSQGGPLH